MLRTGHWYGVNGQRYSMNLTIAGQHGNYLYSRSMNISKSSILKYSRFAKGLGHTSIALSGYSFYKEPNFSNGLDLGVGLGSLLFWKIAPVYFGAKGFYDLTKKQTGFYLERNINPGMQFIFFKE